MGRRRSLDDATIERAVLRIVRTDGAAALTARRIAAEVQRSPAGLYRYHPSVAALEQTVRRRVLRGLVEGVALPTVEAMLEGAAAWFERDPAVAAWALEPSDDWGVLDALFAGLVFAGGFAIVDDDAMVEAMADATAGWWYRLRTTSAAATAAEMREHGPALVRWLAELTPVPPRRDVEALVDTVEADLAEAVAVGLAGPPRERIVATVAGSCLGEVGPAMPMREVARRLGVSVAGLYGHVDRRALDAEVRALFGTTVAATLAREVPPAGPLAELEVVAAVLHRLCDRHPSVGDRFFGRAPEPGSGTVSLVRRALAQQPADVLPGPTDLVVAVLVGGAVRRWRNRAADPTSWSALPERLLAVLDALAPPVGGRA
jgi:AcrR family transcriptional regulator